MHFFSFCGELQNTAANSPYPGKHASWQWLGISLHQDLKPISLLPWIWVRFSQKNLAEVTMCASKASPYSIHTCPLEMLPWEHRVKESGLAYRWEEAIWRSEIPRLDCQHQLPEWWLTPSWDDLPAQLSLWPLKPHERAQTKSAEKLSNSPKNHGK